MEKYGPELKQAVAKAVIEGKYSTMDAARKYDVPQTTVYGI